VRLVVDGKEYQQFESATVTLALDALSNTFSFSAGISDQAPPFPFQGGEKCVAYADGERVLTGYIEVVDISGSDGSHSIYVQGRDRTADFLDSTIGSLSDFRPPITLESAVKKVITHLGSDLLVTDNVSPPAFEKGIDLLAPEPGQACGDFVFALARKRGCLLTSDAHGNMVITRASGTDVDAAIQHLRGSSANNVLTYSVSHDLSKQFNRYLVLTQQSPVSGDIFGSGGAASRIVSQLGLQTDGKIRSGRQLAFLSEGASNAEYAKLRALWAANTARSKSRVLGVTVDGYRNQTGNLWGVNQIVSVESDYAGVHERMLVNTVNFGADGQGGTSTALSLIRQDSYTLSLEEPVLEVPPETDDIFG